MTVKHLEHVLGLQAGDATDQECTLLARIACLLAPMSERDHTEDQHLIHRTWESIRPALPYAHGQDKILTWAAMVRAQYCLLQLVLTGKVGISFRDGEVTFDLPETDDVET